MISPMRKPLLRPRRKTTAEDDHLGRSIIEG
jgi:hypothetical protein